MAPGSPAFFLAKQSFFEGNFMHRTTKRLVSALLAAALCFAAALPAGADYEPWTYEVDSLMGSYGVEYYGDVGFEDPRAGRTAASSPASGGVSTQSAGASGGISTYSAEGGRAVAVDSAEIYADENAETVSSGDGYKITIPAEIAVDTDKTVKTETITGTLEPYQRLRVQLEKKTDGKLVCGGSGEYYIPYSVSLNNGQEFTMDTNETSEDVSMELDIKLGSLENATVSGDYTDTIAFVIECAPKTYAVVYHENSTSANGTMTATTAECTADAVLTANTYTNNGYHFAGWTTTQDVCSQISEIKYMDKATLTEPETLWTSVTGKTYDYEIDLYAQWGYLYTVCVDKETVYGTYPGVYEEKYEKLLMPGESYTWEREDEDAGTDTKGSTVLAWDPLETTIQNISADTTEMRRIKRKRYKIDMNGNGVEGVGGNLGDAGTARVYVNGTLASGSVAEDEGYVKDFWFDYPWGSLFYVDVRPNNGYEVVKISYDNETTDSAGNRCGRLTGTHLIGTANNNVGTPASAVTITFRKTSTTETVTETIEMSSETSSTVDTTKDTDTIDDAADDPEQDSTPDDLMIADADEVLAAMDAAFAVPCPDDTAA